MHLFYLLLLLGGCLAHRIFQDRIPNGDRIPHPCKTNNIWQGAGHQNPLGGGELNPFGEDFNTNGQKWDKTLCEKDSDGDGKTNGEELGDPNCVWKEGTVLESIEGLSHPGVCDPMDSPSCQNNNQFDVCKETEFKCPAITEPGVQKVTLRLKKTAVPAEPTVYMCQAFWFPTDRDYHIIAHEPVIDNENIVHHMMDHECKTKEEAVRALAEYSQPTKCGQVPEIDPLVLWQFGSPASCFSKEYGIKLTKNLYRVLILKIHWNNPEKSADYYDSSGITYYITPRIGIKNLGSLGLRQTHIDIPPGNGNHEEHAICSSKAGELTLVRANQSKELIIREDDFNNKFPKIYELEKPVTLNPGDSLDLKCVYNSKGKNERTFHGDTSTEEMCVSVIKYYPFDSHFNLCESSGMLHLCNGEWAEPNSCNLSSLGQIIPEVVTKIMSNCDQTGVICKPECKIVINEVKSANPCFTGDTLYYTELIIEDDLSEDKTMARKFRLAIRSCD